MNKKNKRIVYFIGQIGLGGTETQMTLLLKYLSKGEYEYHVFVFNPSPFGDLEQELSQNGVQLHFISADITSIPSRVVYLFKWMKKLKPTVIHSWTVHDNVYAGLLGRILNIPIVIGSVRGSLNGTGFSRLPNYLKWASLNCINRLIVNSISIKDELLKVGIKNKKITIMPNCVEIASDQVQERSNGNFIVCTIGNLRKNKNHSFFIHIMKKVVEAVPQAKGWIVGQPVADEPGQEYKLKGLISSFGLLGKVEIMGFQSNTKNLLKQSTVFVLPSLSEGSPNTILEAMSVGVPVVASYVGGIPEIISHGKNGFLFDADDEKGFASAIIDLLRNPEIGHSLKKQGIKTIMNHFHPNMVNKKLEKLYRGSTL